MNFKGKKLPGIYPDIAYEIAEFETDRRLYGNCSKRPNPLTARQSMKSVCDAIPIQQPGVAAIAYYGVQQAYRARNVFLWSTVVVLIVCVE